MDSRGATTVDLTPTVDRVNHLVTTIDHRPFSITSRSDPLSELAIVIHPVSRSSVVKHYEDKNVCFIDAGQTLVNCLWKDNKQAGQPTPETRQRCRPTFRGLRKVGQWQLLKITCDCDDTIVLRHPATGALLSLQQLITIVITRQLNTGWRFYYLLSLYKV
ncbi:hypothetical protein J6590_027604 [Homalodisca vitripennis]|nr:hypothetical protein J6590_027604 [Homalodisca vitripennis]